MAVACKSSNPPGLDCTELDLYRFFAFVFASPSRERFETLALPQLKDALHALWLKLGCRRNFPDFVCFNAYEDYEATYIALFDVGMPEPPVPLFESGHDKTRPAQEIALENTWFHDALGLKWDSSCAVPDYLITQLEFLAAVRYTLENTPDASSKQNLAHLEADFLQRHMLNWVRRANTKLNHASTSLFGTLMNLLAAFLQNRLAEVQSPSSTATARTPPPLD